MKRIIFVYLILLVILSCCIMAVSYFVTPKIHQIYTTSLRGTIFTAFLTMGSFTLSLMTMFMFSLKDKLFDNEDYKNKIASYNEISGNKESRYKQLVNISRLFLFCVFCCFCTSILQFTIGLVNFYIFSSFCLSIAISTLFLALYILFQVWRNLEVWFKLLLEQ